MEPECQTPREREKLSPSGPRWQFQPAQRGFPTSLSRVEGRGTGGPHARPDLGSRHEPCTPIDLLFSKPLLRAPLCQALITGDEAVPQQDKEGKTFISRSVLSLTFSRVSLEGQALLEVLGVLLGAEPSLHTRRAHLPVALERAVFGSQASHRVHTEVVAERGHVARVR